MYGFVNIHLYIDKPEQRKGVIRMLISLNLFECYWFVCFVTSYN
jgi:hypothetical protein